MINQIHTDTSDQVGKHLWTSHHLHLLQFRKSFLYQSMKAKCHVGTVPLSLCQLWSRCRLDNKMELCHENLLPLGSAVNSHRSQSMS